MIEEVLPNLYKIEIPLPRNPLRAINSYIIKGQGRYLIIDTGMNREECMKVMSPGLKKLGVDLEKTDFFITHLHADHLGLVSQLATDASTIYFSKPDEAIVNSEGKWNASFDFAVTNGFPRAESQKALARHPGRLYGSEGRLNFHIVKENDTISIGDYLFTCIETPGHTPGHMCLYEPEKKVFMAGDHILIDITPNISSWSYDWDPLDEYINSLDKIYNLDIELVLPGHRSSIEDCKERIKELKQHHETRANEVLAILEKGAKNAYQTAAHMTWDMDYETWEQFPPQQKWFAFGEAVAHLKYLEEKGKVRQEALEREIVFSLPE